MDIYDDLNNYEDVITVQELRNENKELKVKLEEYATAMEKLQKDYDTLGIGFKNLENNYSSLLKTARSEIERKTQRISQLNVEKDMMVLNAFKSGKNIRRNFNQGVQYQSKISNEKPYKGKGNKNNQEDGVTHKNIDVNNERCGSTTQHTKDTAPGTYDKNKFENAGAKVELSTSRKSYVKDNTTHLKTEHHDTPKAHASSIKDRRKSMPATNMPIDKFSSEEEHERDYHTKDTRTDHLRMEKYERSNINKMSNDRHSNKTSETSSLDDRSHNYHESTSRNMYKGRSSRHHDTSSYRARDKYEVSLKYRKHYSPDKGQKRQHRDYQDDYYKQEQDRYRGRSLKSPSPESHIRYQRHNQEPRSNYDKHSHDHEKHRYHYDEKYSSKNKLSNDYDDEPHSKRQRIEFGDPDAYYKEDRRYYHEKQSLEVPPIPQFSPYDYDMLRQSCQSPDSEHTDAAFTNPVKEIMAIAATPLEDPRVTSKKYVIKKENGQEILSTAVGRNVDIKTVNKTRWNIEPVNIPDALVRRPSQCSDKLVKDIYMDIDDPVSNLDQSLESGEVHETDDDSHEIRNKPKEIQHDSRDHIISKLITEKPVKSATDAENIPKPNIAKYRIPKIGQNNKNSQSKMDVPIIDLGESAPLNKNVYKKGAEDDFTRESIIGKQRHDEREHFPPSYKKYSKSKGISNNQNHVTLTKMAIVADDLELSDDNSDHVDTNRQVVSEKLQKNCKTQLNIKEASKADSENNSCNISSHDTVMEKPIDSADIKNVAEEEKSKESDSNKKQKSKKKKSKSKEISKDSVESIDISEKKTKSKKELEVKPKPKETKEKFSDLFGDSSSLMTPEDLGIPSYLPIPEDAEDAVDMKINQIIDASPQIDKEFSENIQNQNSIEIKKQETKTHDDNPKDVLQKSNTEDKEVVKEIKKKKSSKKKEENIIEASKLPSAVVYENLNPETDLNDPDVVKTVIISTGVQPESTLENKREEVIAKTTTDVEVSTKTTTVDINTFPAIMEIKKPDILKALATSTPYKEFTALNSTEADTRTTDGVCDSDISKAIPIKDNAEQEGKEKETNTLDSQDAPDVRIFVKRRRKLVKRPPMT